MRFGTVGTNFIVDWFIAAGESCPEFVHSAVYSRTAERAAAFAAKHGGVENMFTDLIAMAESSVVDAVYIASPTSEHARQALVFIRAGKHVFVEKPACSNARELEEVLAAAREHGVCFMEGMRSVRSPGFLAARDALSTLGPVRHATLGFCQLSSRWPAYLRGENPNAFKLELCNGALMDLGCYCVYAAVALLGRPTSVTCEVLMLPTGVDSAGTAVLRYPESIATLTFSKQSHSFNRSEIQTEDGTLSIDHLGEFDEVTLQKKGEAKPAVLFAPPASPPLPNNLVYEVAAFIDLVAANAASGKQEDDVLSWQLARDVAWVMDECRSAAGIVWLSEIARSAGVVGSVGVPVGTVVGAVGAHRHHQRAGHRW